MKPWHIEETYSLVREAFGRENEALARESIRSVLDRQAFTRYHYHELMRLSKSFEKKYLKNNLFIDLHKDPKGPARKAFEKYIIAAGAHTTAAVQSVHATPDILAHAIYFSTGHDFKKNSNLENKAGLPFVAGLLRRENAFKCLGKLLFEMQSGDLWRHLAALSNLSKHRSVVRTSFNEDWTGKRKRKRELQFTHFNKGGNEYPPIAVIDLVEPEFDRISILLVKIGHELNSSLQLHAS